ncbi:35359_t:CDS:2, partial [Gigaspora margarita]
MDKQKNFMKSNESSEFDRGGVCLRCNKLNSSRTWCKSCDPKLLTKNWSIDNKTIDNLIKESIHCANEWSDLKRLTNTSIQEFSDKFFSEAKAHLICQSDGTIATSRIVELYDGVRPEIEKGTPPLYITIVNACLDANPSKRPTAKDLIHPEAVYTSRLLELGVSKNSSINDSCAINFIVSVE